MHGDAAFAGQGITAETLNLANLRGYTVGGTVHVIVNNLIGFTANPSDAYSSRFSSDLAKRLPIPIFHVNGEDPDAVVRVGRMALEYRYEFGTDVVVDLIGFRRHGHSEVDDPTITQPILYRKIKDRPLLYVIYAKRVGIDPQPFVEKFQSELDAAAEGRQEHGQEAGHAPVAQLLGAVIMVDRTIPRMKWIPAFRPRVAAHHRWPDELSRGLPHSSQGAEVAGAAARDGLRQTSAGLRHGRGAGFWLARAAGNADSSERTGQPSRHLQPAALGAHRHHRREGIRSAVPPRSRTRRASRFTTPSFPKPR